ncbi:MAG: hypothetical protein AAF804_04555, partial [Bacteroidota bacterium]
MSIRILIVACLLGVALGLPKQGLAQKEGTTRVELRGVIQTETGDPISGAELNTAQGSVSTKTNAQGEFVIMAIPGAIMYVEAEGMKSLEVSTEDIKTKKTIVLTRAPYQTAESDEVVLPFGTLPKRRIVGATTTIKAEEILEYDTRQGILGLINGRAPGVFGTTNIRGLGSAIVVVDGIPRDILQNFNFNVQEIEEITILRDVTARMLYGSQASNGVILVTTKRGQANHQTTSITAETGISQPWQLPNFLGAADYMELYNEALVNDGEAPLYTDEAITATRNGTDPLRFPDQDLLSDTYLKSLQPFNSVIAEFGGGSNLAQYYLNLGYRNVGSFLNLGEGANQRTDQINLRGNIDYQVNPFIKASLDVVAAFDFNQGPAGNYWGAVAGINNGPTLHPNSFPMLIDTNLVNDAELLATAQPVEGGFLLGGTQQFTVNPYGDLVQGGYANTSNRMAQINLGVEFNLENITPGLKLNTYVTGNISNQLTTFLSNQYAVYQPVYVPTPSGEDSLTLNRFEEDLPADGETIGSTSFLRRFGYFGTLSYDRKFGEDHQ